MFVFSCSAAKRDSQHSPAALTARPTTDSSFTEKGKARGRDGQMDRQKTLQGRHVQSLRATTQLAKNSNSRKYKSPQFNMVGKQKII